MAKKCVIASCKNKSGKHGLCKEHSMHVLNKKNGKIPVHAVYIGRPSVFGNPFVVGRDGDRKEVIEEYTLWLKRKIHRDEVFFDQVRSLFGRDLVCWCSPLPCHGDVLREASLWAMGVRDDPPWRGLKQSIKSDGRWKPVKRTVKSRERT